ncbi:TetR/AcrR family transcriptional regulator [Solirubrobacter phytolaccae]|uniref:TetR/AcrR family transcriptional regulator n=1 Tax=Solirubrobacter phytolaccae TaxID=1404360 RepID=A0A9X3SJJ0_9ACTN|nr:TetR/AcrR family transcriptional regulator [Solirubrobacter phytolaccae]MDA0185327.1 TetR/AcrR family transcriptional regulator [Solirubrobacter phytolaccae]
MALPDTDLNRRERKAQRTRREIVRAACELVLEEGYERATIARIAERADLATRTVTTRFASKEAIFFDGLNEALARVEQALERPDGDVVDRLRGWIAEMSQLPALKEDDAELRALRSRAIDHDPELRALFGQHFDRAHDAIARAVAATSGLAPGSAGPQMIAAATVVMLRVVERLAAEDDEQASVELERGFEVLRGALTAL